MAISTATQFNQILWIFAAIRSLTSCLPVPLPEINSRNLVVLYILFGLLFLVMSHLQERLQRQPANMCPLRWHFLQACDSISLSIQSKDLEAQTQESGCQHCTCPVTVEMQLVLNEKA
ncbi:hypothetical protein C8J57DRAFT_62125 [Mycena rebaudengoi]|nr:hypothetical protein C8J57DRAFT_62125 [Mycena rebaudengoi]